jgi:tetrahydromethanopterin S-methyltransferase subunit A
MPFPTVQGFTAADDIATIQSAIADIPFIPNTVKEAIGRLYQSVDAVSTQLYDDVQKLKSLAAANGWSIETDDPSQNPL